MTRRTAVKRSPPGMTFEETVRLFTDNIGKTVDVSVRQAAAEREGPTGVAGFSGRIESVSPPPPAPGACG
jgi:hypothetical protein